VWECAALERGGHWPRPMGALKILIADDHQSVRVLLRNILESVPNWKVCGEASDGTAVIASVRSLHPDVIVMDLMMPECNGLEATRELLRSEPEARVVLTTLHEFPSFAEEARRVGACGCFFKAESGRQLIPAVRAAAERKPFFTSHDLETGRPS
jgi:DNA-binding NarL/FixJ family response regulator